MTTQIKKLFTCFVLFLLLIVPAINVFAASSDTFLNSILLNGATSIIAGPLSPFFPLGLQATSALGDIVVMQVTNGILNAIGGFLVIISTTLMSLGSGLLESVISANSSVALMEVPIVSAGWGIVRNVANAALVIGLIIIAINIIIGNQENKAKKTLINFILIALLINFTPVICGFIIDGSNIIMNSFLTGGVSGKYSTAIANAFIASANQSNATDKIVSTIVIMIFCIVSFVIYVFYALLFLGRKVILWLLVIASPIAFATKVFPDNKYVKKIFPSIAYWDEWWDQFIQWCVIGIPAGLSIYLSNILMETIAGGTKLIPSTGTDTAAITIVTSSLFSYIIPLIVLLAGFFISISSGGQVGSFVGGLATGLWAGTGGRAIGWGKEKIAAGGEWAVEGAKRTAAGTAVGLGSGLIGGYSDAGGGTLSKISGAFIGGATGAAMGGISPEGREKGAAKVAEIKEGIGWSKRGEYSSKIESDVGEAQKRMDNLSDDELRKGVVAPAETRQGNLDKAAMFRSLNKRNKLGDSELDYLVKNKNWAETYNVGLKDISKARPDYAPQLVGKTPYDVVSGMSPSDAGKKINSAAFSSPKVLFSNHYNVINGKIKKGSAEDVKNIKAGLIEELNNYFSTIPGNNTKFTDDNIAEEIQNNSVLLETWLETLKTSSDEASRRKEKTLSDLLDHVTYENI